MRVVAVIAALTVSFALLAPEVFAQTSAQGTVRGYVKDEQGGLLPGTTITATSTTVAGIHTAVTDTDGVFRLGLSPGTYVLTAELQGFSKLVRSGVEVRAGLNIAVDLVLKLGSLSETVEVTAETPMLEVSKPTQSVNISGELQRELPLSSRRDYTDFLEVTPGVNTYQNPQSGGGIYALRGSRIESHVVQVDGADMGSFRQARPDYLALNPDSLEDVQVKTAATDASAPLGVGVVINVATPTGTNKVKGAVSVSYASKSWNGNNNPSGESNKSGLLQADFSLSGPIKKDKVWFFASYRNMNRTVGINRSDRQIALLKALRSGWEPFDNENKGNTVLLKTTAQLTSKHQLDAFYQWDKYPMQSNFTPDEGRYEAETYGGLGYSARLSSVWSSSLTTRMSATYNNKSLNGDSSVWNGYSDLTSRPVHEGTFLSSGLITGTGTVVLLDNTASKYIAPSSKVTIAIDATYYRKGLLGSHEFQVGINLQPRLEGSNTNLYPNGGYALEELVLRDNTNPAGGLRPFHRRYFDTSSVQTSLVHASDNAFYLQDTWRPTERLTASAGVRFDIIKGTDKLVNVLTQDKMDIGPRFGATYVLTSDRHNVIRVSWSRIHDMVSSGGVPSIGSRTPTQTDYYDNNLDGTFETVRVTPGATGALRNREVDPNVHQPYIQEWTVGYRLQLPGQLSFDAAFVRRDYRDRPAQVEINGVYENSVFKGYKNEDLNEIYLITNDTWNWYVYSGLELAVSKRAKRLNMIGSYVRAARHMGGTWQPNDPASFIQPDAFPNNKCLGIPRTAPSNSLSGTADTFGCTGWQDHTGRIAVSYDGPWGFVFGTSYTLQSGSYTGPVVTKIAAPDLRFGPTTVRLSNGRVVSNPLATTIRFAYKDRGEGQVKAPVRHELNVHVGRRFQFGRYRVEAGLDAFNLQNGGAIERFTSSGSNQLYNPQYLAAQSLQSPRALQVSLRFQF